MSPEAQHEWRVKVERAADRIAKVHRSGAQAEARRLVDRLSEELGGELAEVVDDDPHRDVTDPAALADLIWGSQRLQV